jgi:predicted nuclease of predicted toxin-antitoxin system
LKILIDMNMSPLWVQFLKENGIPAAHWSELGSVDSPDPTIRDRAEADGYSILTRDLDFGALLAIHHHQLPTVIQIRAQAADPDSIGAQLLIALKELENEVARGVLITIEQTRTRIRLLPISD